MAKLVQCRIDLNRHEAIREGGAVVLEDGWSLDKPYPYVRPAFDEPFIGTVISTERVWDRHLPVTWRTPWRLFTQPFRPSHRVVWIRLPDPGEKVRVAGVKEQQPGALIAVPALAMRDLTKAESRMQQSGIASTMNPGRRDELMREVFGKSETNVRLKQFQFVVGIDGEFCWDSRNRYPIGNIPIHPTLAALTKIPGVDWVFLTNANTITVIRNWKYDWPEIEAKFVEILTEHDAFLTKHGL